MYKHKGNKNEAFPRLIAFNKPFQVLTQFTDKQGRATLKDYINLPDVYAAGRLDYQSEGLLLLTNDGRLQAKISNPRFQIKKTYWVQVEGLPSPDQIKRLKQGVVLKDGPARALSVQCVPAPELWIRTPSIRKRQHIPTGWLEIVIAEGRNRQVRRMTAAVGLPTLRLVRMQIGPWHLEGLLPGQWRELKV